MQLFNKKSKLKTTEWKDFFQINRYCRVIEIQFPKASLLELDNYKATFDFSTASQLGLNRLTDTYDDQQLRNSSGSYHI